MKLLQAWKAFMMVLKGEELVPKSSLPLAPNADAEAGGPTKARTDARAIRGRCDVYVAVTATRGTAD